YSPHERVAVGIATCKGMEPMSSPGMVSRPITTMESQIPQAGGIHATLWHATTAPTVVVCVAQAYGCRHRSPRCATRFQAPLWPDWCCRYSMGSRRREGKNAAQCPTKGLWQ